MFDASKHRVEGTEAAQFVAKVKREEAKKAAAPAASKPIAQKKAKWRIQHEQFMAVVKQSQPASSGDPSKPSAPVPSFEDPDLVACSFCGRKFNESAHKRHVAICQSVFGKKGGPSGGKTTGAPTPSPKKAAAAPAKPKLGSEQPATVQCQHCGRNFEKNAAERHVPICAKVANKPGQPVARKAANATTSTSMRNTTVRR